MGGGDFNKAKIKFSLEILDKKDIPFILDYENAFNLIQENELTEQEKPIFKKIKSELEKKQIPILFISDNGVGFDDERLGSIFSNGISKKENENSSGSHGNGHFSAFNGSNLRFCLYVGKTSNQTVFSMHAILKTVEKDDKQFGSSYFLTTKQLERISKNCHDFVKNDEISHFIKEKLNEIPKTGSIVGIIGFNFFNEKEENLSNIIKSTIIKNFFVAIEDNKLEVEINLNNQKFMINKNNLKDEFENVLDNEPKSAKDFYNTYINGDRYEVPTNGGEVEVYVNLNTKDTKIAVCRNGMWITDRQIALLRKNNFLENLPFLALILPKPDTKFANLMKLAETNYHSKITISELDRQKEKMLREYLGQIGDFLRDTLPKNNIDKFDIHIDGLDIQMQGDTQKGSKNKSIQTIKTQVQNEFIHTQDPQDTEFEEKDGFSNTKSDFANLTKTENMKNFRSKHSQNKTNIKFTSHKDFNNLCLGIRVDNGTDPSCDNITYESKIKIKSAKNKNIELGVLSNKEAIRIGKVNKDDSFELDIEFSQALQDCILHYDFYEQKES